eukprot:COSAG05_NODE_642_length_8135_cov_20.343703_7_plen_67_part_00
MRANVGKYQSCVVSKLRIIWEQTVHTSGKRLPNHAVIVPVVSSMIISPMHSLDVKQKILRERARGG